MTSTYLLQLIVLLKTKVQQSPCTYSTPRHQLSLDEAGLGGLDVDSVKSSRDYFAYVCIPASETMLHQKRMSIADKFHHRQQTVEINCKNEPY
jgi:hypothetical protein